MGDYIFKPGQFYPSDYFVGSKSPLPGGAPDINTFGIKDQYPGIDTG
jgi:hypothetical protein